jgi:microcystin-dependent protein
LPRNGSGNYSLPQPAFVPNTTISSASVNSDYSDIATALTASIAVDGQTTITGQLKFPNGSSSAPAITFGSDLTTGLSSQGSKKLGFSAGGVLGAVLDLNNQGTGQNGNLFYLNTPTGAAYLCPVGTMLDFAGTGVPLGWTTCQGQNISRTNYPELFFVMSTTYGAGDGSTTFGMPDCRGRATYGLDAGANRITVAGGNFDGTVQGNSGGAQNQTLSQAQLPTFSQTPSFSGGTPTFTGNAVTPTGSIIAAGPASLSVFNGASHVTLSAGADQQIFNTAAFAGTSFVGNALTPTGSISAVTGSISAVTFGSGNSHPILGPAITAQKIIFLGRQ